jgi:hypothetical protein
MGSPKAVLPSCAVLLLAGLQVASAQTQTKTYALEDALQICARVQDATDRLACFEGLARRAAPDASDKVAERADERAPVVPVIAPAPQGAGEDSKSRYVVMRADDYEKEKSTAGEPVTRTREMYDAVVLRAWRYGNGEYHIALTNGEIWKSQASDNPRPVKDGEEVELHPGAVGSWFMQFKTIKRPTIRVKLVE